MQYLTERITIDENMLNGKPAIRGMRISVQTILEFLSAGTSKSEILENYPFLKNKDIDACLDFAAKMLDKNFQVFSTHMPAPAPKYFLNSKS